MIFVLFDFSAESIHALLHGAQWLHLSGVSPALGPEAAQATLDAARAAVALGIKVSFDGNFRPKLWERWDGDAKVWFCSLGSEAALEGELAWLQAEVYGGRRAQVEVEALDALTRYALRRGLLNNRVLQNT